MMDPLSCLREYTINKKHIVEKNNFLIFGKYCWPKSVKTNYQVTRKQRDADKEYYTLEAVFFLLNNLILHHPAYVNFARRNHVPFIRRPDRKKLLAYVMGKINTCSSIDASAPIVYPTEIKLEHQKEITDDVKDSSFQSSTLSSSEADVSGINSQINLAVTVKEEIEKQEESNIKPSTEELSLLSSTEANFSRNEKQFTPLQRVKQAKEDIGKVNKKLKIENSSTLLSSETSTLRNVGQRYFNYNHTFSAVKQEEEDWKN